MPPKDDAEADDEETLLNELDLVDAQRIIAILENALAKLSVLEKITPDEPEEGQQGEEVTEELEAHRKLELKYEELVKLRLVHKRANNKIAIKQNEAAIAATKLELTRSTKMLCRNLQDNPNIVENNHKIQKERTVVYDLLERTVMELYNGHFDSLLRRVTSEQKRKLQQSQLVLREKELSSTLADLRHQLSTQKKEYESELKEKTAQASKLKDEVHEMRSRSAIEQKYLAKEKLSNETTTQRMNDTREAQLLKEMQELDLQRHREELSHEQTLNFLLAKTNLMGVKQKEWETKYLEVEVLTQKVEMLKKDRGGDQQRLDKIKKEFKVDESEKEARAAEERRQKQMKEMQEAERRRRIGAAIRIQAYWRMHSAKRMRQAAANKGKGKAKGGGGKKGKKK